MLCRGAGKLLPPWRHGDTPATTVSAAAPTRSCAESELALAKKHEDNARIHSDDHRSNVLRRVNSRTISKHDRQMECGDQFRGWEQTFVALRRSRLWERDFPPVGSNVEPVGAGQTFRSEVDSRRPKLGDVFGCGGISNRQRWPRRGNIDVQGKIRNAGRDHRRGGIRSACR